MCLLYDRAVSFLSILPKRSGGVLRPQKDSRADAHSSFIHNSPKLETPQCLSTGEWIKNCEIVIQWNTLSNGKELTTTVHNSMDKSVFQNAE